MSSLPSVVIVGRPNVGKSTLFNAILGQRRSIVGDEPGITRDRIQGEAAHRGRRFELIDTGGIIPNDDEMIPSQILKQARVALETASQVIFLIDGRTEITGIDRDLAAMLRKIGKPVTLVVNKIDSTRREDLRMSFTRWDSRICFRSRPSTVWASRTCSITSRPDFPVAENEAEPADVKRIKVAILGRPNVGKSTLLNTLTVRSAPLFRRSPEPRATRWMKLWFTTASSMCSWTRPESGARARPI